MGRLTEFLVRKHTMIASIVLPTSKLSLEHCTYPEASPLDHIKLCSALQL